MRFLYTTLSILFITFSGCKKENLSNNDMYLDVILNKDVMSRISENEDGSGNFTDGESVNFYHAKDYKLTYNNGKWYPLISLDEIGYLWGEYISFYPYTEKEYSADTRSHSIQKDQSSIENYKKSDLLYAYTFKSSEDITNKINMVFNHAMHSIIINFTSEKGTIPNDLEVTIKSVTSEIIVAPSSENKIQYYGNTEIGEVIPYRIEPGKYKAIIAPEYNMQDVSNEWITIKTGGKTIYYSLPSSYELSMDKQTILNLNLTDSETVEGEFANKTFWVGNLEKLNPPYDEDNLKHYIITDINSGKYEPGIWFDSRDKDWSYKQYLSWKEGCGWYDVNKEMTDDTNLCWAASCSNLLHWWIQNNKEYIDKYYKINPNATKCPSPDFTPGKVSEIWQMYKDAFQDRTGNMGDGLRWFFSGAFGQNIFDYDSEWKGYKGIFNDVFGGTPPNMYDYRTVDKTRFNEIIKMACKNGWAIGFVTNENTPPEGSFSGGRPDLHAMTIWGVEYDKNADVSAIYFTNNNVSSEPNPTLFKLALMYRVIVKYDEDNNVFIKNNEYNNKNRKQINAVITLGLGKEKWEEYFNKQNN